MNGSEAALRRAAWTLQAVGVVGSTAFLLVRWASWGGFGMAEVGDLLGLLILFWSPYAALAVATRILGRGRVRLALLAVASLVAVAWDGFWRIASRLPDPDAVLEVMAPALITGAQWIGVAVTLALVVVIPAPRVRE